MRRRGLSALLVVLLAVAAVKVGQEGYRWFAHAEDREELRGMTGRLESAGLEVVRTQIAADSMRRGIEAVDSDLDEARRRVGSYDVWGRGGTLPAHLHRPYLAELDSYNRRVDERNARVATWEEVVSRNHRAVARYNDLADSVRAVAARLGEPFYPVPSPVELAVRHGLLRTGRE